jgi:hypothetical protein
MMPGTFWTQGRGVRKDILLPSMARLYAEGVGWYASMIRIANRSPLAVSSLRGAMQILLALTPASQR